MAVLWDNGFHTKDFKFVTFYNKETKVYFLKLWDIN
jgi:hypothetical protein